ncbi:MAG TPA: hypothetical protein VGV38_09855 [Pyrinomonadaceae bacterium]|nr:hypothetical protein [Pyrinomonadaceae bacterium]
MKPLSRPRAFAALAFVALLSAGCSSSMNDNRNTTATTNVSPPAASPTPAAQSLSVVERPQKIKDQMASRGEQDSAAPALKIVEPREGSTVNGAVVPVRLSLGGDLKGYQPHKNPDGTGNHIHVILDNEPYEAYYELGQPFELRNLTEGTHTLRVFASRPWHESYKNDGSFQMVTFTVKGGGDASKPTTTGTGQTMANNNANASASPSASPAREGKDYSKPTQAGAVARSKPLLTYSRPKGDHKGADAEAIMIDFWLSNAKLVGDGGEYLVRYSVDGAPPQQLDKWQPIWLKGFTPGKHKVRLELVDRNGSPVDNGGYNTTEREITVTQ